MNAEVSAPIAQSAPEIKTADQGNVEAKGIETAPNTSGMTKDEAREAIRRYKVKVNGEEMEVDEDELKRGYSHQRAANKAMQEGLKKQRQAEEFISMLQDKGKLFDVISKMGHDPRALAEEYLTSKIEEDLMDPREKEMKTYKEKLRHYEELEKMQAEKQRQQEYEDLKNRHAQEYTKSFIEAMEESKVPKTKETLQKMAKYVKDAAKIGYKLTAKEAAKMAEEDHISTVRSIASQLDGEMLIKILGDEVTNKVRKWDLSRIKDPNQNIKTPETQAPKTTRSERFEGKRMSQREWREFNNRK